MNEKYSGAIVLHFSFLLLYCVGWISWGGDGNGVFLKMLLSYFKSIALHIYFIHFSVSAWNSRFNVKNISLMADSQSLIISNSSGHKSNLFKKRTQIFSRAQAMEKGSQKNFVKWKFRHQKTPQILKNMEKLFNWIKVFHKACFWELFPPIHCQKSRTAQRNHSKKLSKSSKLSPQKIKTKSSSKHYQLTQNKNQKQVKKKFIKGCVIFPRFSF